MAGRVDDTTHAAAIAKIGGALKFASELRAHLKEIVNGPAFKGSHRSQEFLKHIVERALQGDFEDLRERQIGITLFGRPAAFDTAEDAIVRVTASDVRKRLLQHYGKAGRDSRFRIDLPSGSYIPEFRCCSSAVLDGLEAGAPGENDANQNRATAVFRALQQDLWVKAAIVVTKSSGLSLRQHSFRAVLAVKGSLTSRQKAARP